MVSILSHAEEVHANQEVVNSFFKILDKFEANLESAMSLERGADAERQAAFMDVQDRIMQLVN